MLTTSKPKLDKKISFIEYSPEHSIRLSDYPGPTNNNLVVTSDGASDCGSESSSECPEELYNLTKLAEVSLAAAAGTLVHPSRQPTAPRMQFFDRPSSEETRLLELGTTERQSDDSFGSDITPVDFTVSLNAELSILIRNNGRVMIRRMKIVSLAGAIQLHLKCTPADRAKLQRKFSDLTATTFLNLRKVNSILKLKYVWMQITSTSWTMKKFFFQEIVEGTFFLWFRWEETFFRTKSFHENWC